MYVCAVFGQHCEIEATKMVIASFTNRPGPDDYLINHIPSNWRAGGTFSEYRFELADPPSEYVYNKQLRKTHG